MQLEYYSRPRVQLQKDAGRPRWTPTVTTHWSVPRAATALWPPGRKPGTTTRTIPLGTPGQGSRPQGRGGHDVEVPDRPVHPVHVYRPATSRVRIRPDRHFKDVAYDAAIAATHNGQYGHSIATRGSPSRARSRGTAYQPPHKVRGAGLQIVRVDGPHRVQYTVYRPQARCNITILQASESFPRQQPLFALVGGHHAAGPVNCIDLPRLEEIAMDPFAGVRASDSPRAHDGGGLFRWDEAAVLTDQNKKYAADNVDMMIVAFLVPWCANSQLLAPVLDAVVAHAKSAVAHEVMVTRVEAPSNPNLCAEFDARGLVWTGAEGYPQVFWKVHGRIILYVRTTAASTCADIDVRDDANTTCCFTSHPRFQRDAHSNCAPDGDGEPPVCWWSGFSSNPTQPNVKNRGRPRCQHVSLKHLLTIVISRRPCRCCWRNMSKSDRDRTAAAFGAKVVNWCAPVSKN